MIVMSTRTTRCNQRSEFGAGEDDPCEFDVGEVGSGEIGSGEVGTGEVGTGKIGIGEVGTHAVNIAMKPLLMPEQNTFQFFFCHLYSAPISNYITFYESRSTLQKLHRPARWASSASSPGLIPFCLTCFLTAQ